MKESQSNRGMALEKTVKEIFKHYEEMGIFCHKLEVKQSHGAYLEKSPFDFLCYYKSKLYAFDTKNCNKGKIAIQNFKLHQIKALTDVENQGGDGFFLVYFKEHKKLNKITASDIRLMMQDDMKSIEFCKERVISIDFLGVLK